MRAPIILFVYNRPDHTAKTLAALSANPEFSESPLYIFSDAAKNSGAEDAVNQVRKLIAQYALRENTFIHLNVTNQGLAQNIVDGVTQVINQHGCAIVLEDDIIVSPHFLSFMNRALELYAADKRVWHINGWSHPIELSGLGDVYFSPLMNCWGWATWADRWQSYHKDPAGLISSWSLAKIRRFNLNNSHDFWGQVLDNYRGHLNTWAIFWYATIFENNGLCLTPSVSLTQNIGFDGSGENCSAANHPYVHIMSNGGVFSFDCKDAYIDANNEPIRRIQVFLRNGSQCSFFCIVKRWCKLIYLKALAIVYAK